MKKCYTRKLKFTLVFTAIIFLGISNVHAQPADTRPFVKYLVNNYSSLSKKACDTCKVLIGTALERFRPIPFPEAPAIQALTGIDVKDIPGISAPNFFGGGSPEIKGLVKEVAGMKDITASTSLTRNGELLYFKNGAKGVAVSTTGKIYTSSLTIPLGSAQSPVNGFFSFRSEPRILPTFNEVSDRKFMKSPDQVYAKDTLKDNPCKQVAYFAIDPRNENIMYASLRDSGDYDERRLVRRNSDGTWRLVDWKAGGGVLTEDVWGALAVDQYGSLYIADPKKHVIVRARFDGNGDVVTWEIIAGQFNTPGYKNDSNGPDALFKNPGGICVDLDGNIYIGDAGNNRVRMIDDGGEVTNYAGDGTAGFRDDDDAFDARFNGPTAVAFNEQTQSLFVVDFNNKLVREIDDDQEVSTLAGNAGSPNPLEPAKFALQLYYFLAKLNLDPDEAKFDNPTGIAIDPSGHGLYVSDGNYVKYVSTFPAQFIITSAFRESDSTFLPIPILPPGIIMNANNGSFYGIPLLAWEPTTYAISVINSQGASLLNGVVTFEVLACPRVPDTTSESITISVSQLPYTWNGKQLDNAGTAVATLQSSLGCDSIVVLTLNVKPDFNYNSEPYLLSLGQQITPIVPTTAGSPVETFSIIPPLSAGLVLNAQTGVISGTPLTTTNQLLPAIGPRTPPQYPAPWTLEAGAGADLTEFKISDGNQKTVFENNSDFRSLAGTAGQGTGTAGAYTDFSGLGAIKLFSNSPYKVRLSNALYAPGREFDNLNYTRFARETFNYMNSYAVYIDYNRDGDFADAGERVYISGGPQTPAHAEAFNLNIPLTASPGVTKMRIYAVEAKTAYQLYLLDNGSGGYNSVYRTTEQALSFYPFFNDISSNGEFHFTLNMDYGEFEDYNIDIISPATQSYVVTGSNSLGTDSSTVTLAINIPSASITNTTICSTELPYHWNGLTFTTAGKDTAHLVNQYGADSAATLNLVVKQATSSVVDTAYCGPYTYRGVVYKTSGDYLVHTFNAVGCDSAITFRFRQIVTTSTTTVEVIPSALPYYWNDSSYSPAGTYSVRFTNAEGCDSVATLVLKVQFNVYYPPTNTLAINQAIQPIIPQFEGNYTPGPDNPNYGCSITPNLPLGLQLDINTGIISGTPAQLSPYTTYTITRQQQGAIPSIFRLSVGHPTSSTTTVDNCGPFTWNSVEYTTPGTKSVTLKNQYGFDSTATLLLSIRNLSATTVPLLLHHSAIPYTWNDTTITKEGAVTIHRINAAGCDSAVTAIVTISPKISYQSPNILAPNVPIAPIIPQQTGGAVMSYTIRPALVAGLLFDQTNGIISGTPADTLLKPVTHTIHAFNNAGADSTEMIIAVCNPIATSFTLTACDHYVWNDSTYRSSTTHTRTLKNRGGCDSVVTMHLTVRYSTTGPTDTITACGSYLWHDVAYDSTGVYTKVYYPNAAGCDSTVYLKLTIKKLTYHNRYVNLNQSDLPYTWRGLTFNEPGTQSIILENSVGCDSVLSMIVGISDVLPDISYATKDTILYWEKTIDPPISMNNTGTPVPALKLGERDELIAFSNGPGDLIKPIKGPNGVYYARVLGNSNIFKLTSSGVWSVFAALGGPVEGMTIDKSGNLYVGISETGSQVRKITPGGGVSIVPGFRTFSGIHGVALDPEGNLIIHSQLPQNQIRITRLNLSTNQYVQQDLDNSPYFDYYPEDFKTDSKGNIYMYRNVGGNVVKIKPDGHMSGIGRNETTFGAAFIPGNGIDARIPPIASIAIDSTNDNVYVMANGRLLRVDTAENVTALTGPFRTFDQYKDQIFSVDSGKISIVNSSTGKLYTVNVYGVGSLPFMDNYGASGISGPQFGTVNFEDFDKRIRLDSSGAIVGTPRATYSQIGTRYGSNSSIAYAIIAANQSGISTAPMIIHTKGITYKSERFVTTSLPFIWKGMSFYAPTDTATYYARNKTQNNDTMYVLHLVYERAPEPIITKGDCVEGQITLTATNAARNAISLDGNNVGAIKNTVFGRGLSYYGSTPYTKPDGSPGVNFHTSFEVWLKPETVDSIQYLITRDTIRTFGNFFGLSIQNRKFVFEFTKGASPFAQYKISSGIDIIPNVWTHVAASYYDSTMYIFVNGKLEGKYQTPENTFNAYYDLPGTYVGIFPDFSLGGLGHQFGFKGEMDELRAWATRRDTTAIRATMNSIVDPSSAGLGLYYRFDGEDSNRASDISRSGAPATFIKPATNVSHSGAPINFASHKWMPGGDTTKSVVVNVASNTLYTLTVKDYKGTSGSDSLLVYPTQGPTITAPAAVSRTSSPTSCTAFVSDADLGSATATDNCPGLTVTITGVPAGNLFPLGVTTITYTATNAAGRTKTATQTVTVTDISKPAFITNLSANPDVIWPPDNKMKNVALTYTTMDNCGTVTNKITVTSTDQIAGDWVVSNDHLVQLRAKRTNGKDRVYTITVTPVDGSGNVGTPQSTNVYIIKDNPATIAQTSGTTGNTPVASTAGASAKQNNLMAPLQAQAFPNPSHGQFTLLVQGKNNEPVSIRISDIMGRLVEERKGLSANGTLTLGASYRPGIFIAEVLQGKEKVVIKLMKQTE